MKIKLTILLFLSSFFAPIAFAEPECIIKPYERPCCLCYWQYRQETSPIYIIAVLKDIRIWAGSHIFILRNPFPETCYFCYSDDTWDIWTSRVDQLYTQFSVWNKVEDETYFLGIIDNACYFMSDPNGKLVLTGDCNNCPLHYTANWSNYGGTADIYWGMVGFSEGHIPPFPYDFNDDGIVDWKDYALLTTAWDIVPFEEMACFATWWLRETE